MNSNEQFRRAASTYDNACDCCGQESSDALADRAAELRDALRENASFIGEAIGNGDLANLVAGFTGRDSQRCWDAVSDLVDEYLKDDERRLQFTCDTEVDALETLCRLHGVAL